MAYLPPEPYYQPPHHVLEYEDIYKICWQYRFYLAKVQIQVIDFRLLQDPKIVFLSYFCSSHHDRPCWPRPL